MKGLIFAEDDSLTLTTDIPFPSPTLGSLTLRVLATLANPNFTKLARDPKQGNDHGFTQPRPFIPGSHAVGRVVAVGPDTFAFRPGQLVMVDIDVHARDDPDTRILWGMFDGNTPESKKLHADVWRNSSYAEYLRAPLENTYALDEKILCGPVEEGGFGYSFSDLVNIASHTVPYGGLRSINFQPGQTLVVSPATGMFSGAAVATGLAMGGTVIAASRSAEGLEKVKKIFPQVRTVVLSGDVQPDTDAILAANGNRPVDAFLELSPPAATGSTLITSCMLAVKPYGHICLMGGRSDASIPCPWTMLVYRNLTIKGGFMYEREDVWALVRLFESGRLKLGEKNGFGVAGTFGLDEWDACADLAIANKGFGSIAVVTP